MVEEKKYEIIKAQTVQSTNCRANFFSCIFATWLLLAHRCRAYSPRFHSDTLDLDRPAHQTWLNFKSQDICVIYKILQPLLQCLIFADLLCLHCSQTQTPLKHTQTLSFLQWILRRHPTQALPCTLETFSFMLVSHGQQHDRPTRFSERPFAKCFLAEGCTRCIHCRWCSLCWFVPIQFFPAAKTVGHGLPCFIGPSFESKMSSTSRNSSRYYKLFQKERFVYSETL